MKSLCMVELQQVFNTLMPQGKKFLLNLFLQIDGHENTNFVEVTFAMRMKNYYEF